MAQEVDADSLPPDTAIVAVSYFGINPKCVHQPCDRPVVSVRMTTVVSQSFGRRLICATVCEHHEAWERADLKRAIEAHALSNQPNRN